MFSSLLQQVSMRSLKILNQSDMLESHGIHQTKVRRDARVFHF